jgi:hypothetical protein
MSDEEKTLTTRRLYMRCSGDCTQYFVINKKEIYSTAPQIDFMIVTLSSI